MNKNQTNKQIKYFFHSMSWILLNYFKTLRTNFSFAMELYPWQLDSWGEVTRRKLEENDKENEKVHESSEVLHFNNKSCTLLFLIWAQFGINNEK